MEWTLRTRDDTRPSWAAIWTVNGTERCYSFGPGKYGERQATEHIQRLRPEHLPARVVRGVLKIVEEITFVEEDTTLLELPFADPAVDVETDLT